MDNNIQEGQEGEAQEIKLEVKDKGYAAEKKFAISARTINIALIAVIILALGVLAYTQKGWFVAATINGSPISRFSIIQRLEKAYGSSTLDTLINQKLIVDAAEKNGTTTSADEVSAEIKEIETQLQAQGRTLDEALATQGMTRRDLETRIVVQKNLEKLLGDKIKVTDEEINKYVSDNKITLPEGQEESYTGQIRSQLEQEKMNTEAQNFLAELRAKAKINYFVKY